MKACFPKCSLQIMEKLVQVVSISPDGMGRIPFLEFQVFNKGLAENMQGRLVGETKFKQKEVVKDDLYYNNKV